MDKTKNSSVDWGSLGIGILLVIMALISFRNPFGTLVKIVIVFAIFAILKGIFEILIRNKAKKLTGYKSYGLIILGIINILIGGYFLFNIGAGIVTLSFVFAIWFILDSVFSLFTLDLAKVVSKGYFWFSGFINILGIILGFMLLFDPITSALTISFMVGLYFLLFGINYIIYSFLNRS